MYVFTYVAYLFAINHCHPLLCNVTVSAPCWAAAEAVTKILIHVCNKTATKKT